MGLGSEYPERFTYGNRRTERRGQVYPLKIILNLLVPVSGRIRFSIDGETDAKKHGGKLRMSRRTVQSTGIFPPQ